MWQRGRQCIVKREGFGPMILFWSFLSSFVSDAPRERSLSNVNFVSVNKASASEARKEIVRW
jgi:hypothetical protein